MIYKKNHMHAIFLIKHIIVVYKILKFNWHIVHACMIINQKEKHYVQVTV